ncbi:MAG: hypothetical protein QOK10_1277, partial [Pseudonocardiales bacterium]|nr:hypothetical protein [Pseudonocardiales bacterium]
WQATERRLAVAGLLGDDGGLSDAGRSLRQRIEDTTDQRAMAPWEHLGSDACDRLLELARPLSKLVVDHGAFGRR